MDSDIFKKSTFGRIGKKSIKDPEPNSLTPNDLSCKETLDLKKIMKMEKRIGKILNANNLSSGKIDQKLKSVNTKNQ